jgi:hypothetical protein
MGAFEKQPPAGTPAESTEPNPARGAAEVEMVNAF